MKVWDLPTRLYHWVQAVLFVGLLASGFSKEDMHSVLGISLFILIMWRISWGFVGSETSRFRQFVKSPKAVVIYLKGEGSPHARHSIGHNPAGGWMVVLMITVLLLQCCLGLLISGVIDLALLPELLISDTTLSWFEDAHFFLAYLLIGLVLVHLIAIAFYKLDKKPLVWAMIVGYQKANILFKKGNARREVVIASNTRALLMLVVSLFVTMAIIAPSIM
ncbi:cytochrome b/b6 domain-containing protein [Litoribrevibacter albus]|nr:cytochrome b/b6 domain-containing protein [Litoribrevibacter albus]